MQLRAGASHVVALAVTKRRPQMEEIGAFQHGALGTSEIADCRLTGPSEQGCLDPMEKNVKVAQLSFYE